MGVINSLGIIGIIDNTSPNYSTVMSILNKKSQINAKDQEIKSFWLTCLGLGKAQVTFNLNRRAETCFNQKRRHYCYWRTVRYFS